MLKAHIKWGEALLYYADITYPTRAIPVPSIKYLQLTGSGRELANLNAVLNSYLCRYCLTKPVTPIRKFSDTYTDNHL